MNVDEAPVAPSPCKKARYTAHATGGCKGCHDTVDPIGFGLERFDREGRYRTTDDGLPNCPIDGQGTVVGAPAGDLAFSGPDGLADALIASGAFEKCVVTQVFRFSQGRREGANDIPAILERVVAVPPQTSPRQAWQALFSNFTPSGVSAAERARLDMELRSRRSVLDLVRADTERLVPKLGTADRRRLQRHLDELRDLERRVATIAPPQTSACMRPADPGADPAVGTPQGNDGTDNTYAQNLGYSNEEGRANLFIDLIHLAMVCDLTRVASLQMTMFQSHLNMYALTGQTTDCHELGHGGVPGGTMAMSKGIAWHVKHFTRLVQKFKDTPEGNGNMLDSSAMLYLLEGGHGWDPEGVRDNSSHSTENMACMLAGRAGGLSPGQHVVATGKHPANVIVTAMKAVGVNTDQLGEVTGDLPQLRTTGP